MAKKLPQLQVLIPYEDLVALLKAAEMVDELTESNRSLDLQLDALRGQFTELLDKFQELRDYVID